MGLVDLARTNENGYPSLAGQTLLHLTNRELRTQNVGNHTQNQVQMPLGA